jgi:hypothetical protein
MEKKSDYLIIFLITIFGLDILDRYIKIPEYVTVPIILLILVIVFLRIVYYSFFKRSKSSDNHEDY